MATYPVPTYTNSTDRLLAVADIILHHPEQHDQDIWTTLTRDPAYLPDVVLEGDCGTACCTAGWLAVMMPPGERCVAAVELGGYGRWVGVGMAAGDLSADLARLIFDGDFDHPGVPGLLVGIAALPPGERTLGNVAEAGLLKGSTFRGCSWVQSRRAHLP